MAGCDIRAPIELPAGEEAMIAAVTHRQPAAVLSICSGFHADRLPGFGQFIGQDFEVTVAAAEMLLDAIYVNRVSRPREGLQSAEVGKKIAIFRLEKLAGEQ